MRKRKLRKLRIKRCAYCCTIHVLALVTIIVGMYAFCNWHHYSDEERRTRTADKVVIQEMNELGCPPRRVVVAREYGASNTIHYEVKPCFWLGITRKESAAIWRELRVGRTYRVESAEINGFRTIEYVERLD